MPRNRWTVVLLPLAVIGGALLARAGNAQAPYIVGANAASLADRENARPRLRKSADLGNWRGGCRRSYPASGAGRVAGCILAGRS